MDSFRCGPGLAAQLDAGLQLWAPSGPNGASLGPFISLSAGYVWTIAGTLNAGVHAIYRYRRSKDETNSIVYERSYLEAAWLWRHVGGREGRRIIPDALP